MHLQASDSPRIQWSLRLLSLTTMFCVSAYCMPASVTLHNTALLCQNTLWPFCSPPRRPTSNNGGLHTFAVRPTTCSCNGLYTLHIFKQKSNKYAKYSLIFPLKNGIFTFYMSFKIKEIQAINKDGVVSTPWAPLAFQV